ncbi:MAG: hypothetical protein M3P04_09450, partial [Actinomycetota bacterium]|nr:hypothetical protein [Actinomycetota bacterium]
MQIPPVAGDQNGLFSRQQALLAATSEGAFHRARRAACAARLATGVYVEAGLEGLDRRERHLLEARATVLSLGDQWCVARRTAAVLHGLPLLGRAADEVQLTRGRTTRGARSANRHRHINALLDGERTTLDGIATTTLARTVFDLARRESFRSAVVVADAALRTGLPRAELLALLEAHRGWAGTRQAKTVFAFADGRAESPLESLGRAACLDGSLP